MFFKNFVLSGLASIFLFGSSFVLSSSELTAAQREGLKRAVNQEASALSEMAKEKSWWLEQKRERESQKRRKDFFGRKLFFRKPKNRNYKGRR